MIKILLADDHEIVRNGLAALIADEADMKVVGEASTGKEVLSQAAALRPEVIIMDIGMPELNGIEATRGILKRHPKVRIIALSMHCDKRYITAMLRAGAHGFVPKESAYQELIRAIREAHAGRTYLSPKVADTVAAEYVRRLDGETSGMALSSREREVLKGLAEGRTVREIGDELHISHKTVETYRVQIMQKLDLHTVADLTKYAIREGLTTLE